MQPQHVTSVPFVYDLRQLQEAQIPLYIGDRLPAINSSSLRGSLRYGAAAGTQQAFLAIPVRGVLPLPDPSGGKYRTPNAAYEKERYGHGRDG